MYMKCKKWFGKRKKKSWEKYSGLPQTYYLLLRGYPWVHDGDEFLGIYADTEKLKQAYFVEKIKLEKLHTEGHCRGYCLYLYRFIESAYDKEEGIQVVKPQELWKEE